MTCIWMNSDIYKKQSVCHINYICFKVVCKPQKSLLYFHQINSELQTGTFSKAYCFRIDTFGEPSWWLDRAQYSFLLFPAVWMMTECRRDAAYLREFDINCMAQKSSPLINFNSRLLRASPLLRFWWNSFTPSWRTLLLYTHPSASSLHHCEFHPSVNL